MPESLIYRSATIYELVMLGLYGRHYPVRTRAIADLIPPRTTVLDVCCGPATLYLRHLKAKGISYRGIDVNPRFVARLRRRGAAAEVQDVNVGQALPEADYVILQASLYHFLPDPAHVVDRMLAAARRQVIIAEPIRNLANSPIHWIAAVARHHTDAGGGKQPHRFNEQTLDDFFRRYKERVSRSFLLPGGREKVYVLDAQFPAH